MKAPKVEGENMLDKVPRGEGEEVLGRVFKVGVDCEVPGKVSVQVEASVQVDGDSKGSAAPLPSRNTGGASGAVFRVHVLKSPIL